MSYDEIMAKIRNAQPFEISPNEAGRLAREAMEAKASERFYVETRGEFEPIHDAEMPDFLRRTPGEERAGGQGVNPRPRDTSDEEGS